MDFTKHRVLPVTSLVFWKFFYSLRTCYKELIWCTNHPNVCIQIFSLWVCYFPIFLWVSLISLSLKTHKSIRITDDKKYRDNLRWELQNYVGIFRDSRVWLKNAEAVVRRCSVKTVFWKISQNSQETPVPESLF